MPFVCARSRPTVAFCVQRRDQWRGLLGLKAWPAQARAHCRVLARFSCCDAAVACGLPWRQQIGQLQWSSSSRVKPPLRSFPPLACSVPNTHLVFCTAVTAAPRSLPAAPSRVFCWALPHPHSAPHPRPHSNQPRACPAAPSVVVVVSSCGSSSAPCVRVLSVVVSSCCSTSLSTSLSYFRQCALTRCAFFDSIAFRDPACIFFPPSSAASAASNFPSARD